MTPRIVVHISRNSWHRGSPKRSASCYHIRHYNLIKFACTSSKHSAQIKDSGASLKYELLKSPSTSAYGHAISAIAEMQDQLGTNYERLHIEQNEKQILLKKLYNFHIETLENQPPLSRNSFNIRGTLEYIAKHHSPGKTNTQAQLDDIASTQRYKKILDDLCEERQIEDDDARRSRLAVCHYFSGQHHGNEDRIVVNPSRLALGPSMAVAVESYLRFHGKSYVAIIEGVEVKVEYGEDGGMVV